MYVSDNKAPLRPRLPWRVVSFASSVSYGYLNNNRSPRLPEDTRHIASGLHHSMMSSYRDLNALLKRLHTV